MIEADEMNGVGDEDRASAEELVRGEMIGGEIEEERETVEDVAADVGGRLGSGVARRVF